MARDVDYIVGGFQGLGQGLQGIGAQQREDEEKRLAGAEKRFQERRPLPTEQQGMYRQLTGQPQGQGGMDPQAMKQEFIERRRAGEDPKAIAVDFKLRMQKGGLPEQGRYDQLGKRNTLGTMPSEEGAEPYGQSAPAFNPRAQQPVGGPATAQRPASMRDVASLQDLSAIGASQRKAEGDPLAYLRYLNAVENTRLSGQRLGETRQRTQQGWMAQGRLADQFAHRENTDYTKMAGETPFVVPRLRTLISQAPLRAPPPGDYMARRVADAMGGKLQSFIRLGADTALDQDERNYRREVAQVVQGYRRGEFGSQVTGLEFQLSDMLAGEQLSVADTQAALTALEQLTSNRLARAQATTPRAAQRIESGTTAINRGMPNEKGVPTRPPGPQIAPLAPMQPRPSTPSDLGVGSSPQGRQVRGYKYNASRTQRRPVYADGTEGAPEPVQ